MELEAKDIRDYTECGMENCKNLTIKNSLMALDKNGNLITVCVTCWNLREVN